MTCCLTWYRKHVLSGADDSIPAFDLDGFEGHAQITSIYDGDTFNACIYLHGRMLKFKFRTLGYDAPEIKPSLQMNDRDTHVRMAKIAREDFKRLCDFDSSRPHSWWNPLKCHWRTNGWVWIECGKNDKYGRTLVKVFRHRGDRISINDKMIALGANNYEGGTKQDFTFI